MINWQQNTWKTGVWKAGSWRERVVEIIKVVGRRVAARLPNWMMKTSGSHFKIR